MVTKDWAKHVSTEFEQVYAAALARKEEWTNGVSGVSITNSFCKIIFGQCTISKLLSFLHTFLESSTQSEIQRGGSFLF